MTLLRFSPSLITAACLAALSPAYAQDPTERPTERSQPQAGTTKPVANRVDEVLASWIMVVNNNEIQLAQTAQSRIDNPEIKQFAEMLIKDHREFGRKLAKFSSVPAEAAGDHGAMDPTGQPRDDRAGKTDRPGATGQAGDRGAMRGRSDEGGFQAGQDREIDHVGLIKELGQKHLESAKEALNEKQGDEYAHCFVGMQVMGHMATLDKLEVFSKHASTELRQVLQEGQQAVQQHLDKAKELAKQLEEHRGAAAPDRGR